MPRLGPQTDTIMDRFGSDLCISERNIAKCQEQRFKRGECKTCGRKTHKISRLPFGRRPKRDPLTIEGEVTNGVCLRCAQPVDAIRGSHKPAVPDMLDVDDDMTVGSEITMDPCLTDSWRGSFSGDGMHAHAMRDRPHHMASHFDPVEEETSITEFGRHAEELGRHDTEEIETNRREREREQDSRLCQQPGGGGRGDARSLTTSVSSAHNKQKFHPLSQVPQFTSSELSMSVADGDMAGELSMLYADGDIAGISPDVRSQQPGGGGGRGDDSSMSSAHNKLEFHPLSQVTNFTASELSISLADGDMASNAPSVQSRDSDRILRLCQGSRGRLTREVEKSPPRVDRSSPTAKPVSKQEEGDSESEESIERWENHDHLLRTKEKQRTQQFHPLAVQQNSFSNSEQSISITDDKSRLGGDAMSHSTSMTSAHNKQKFHPLSKVPDFNASEQSISLADGDTASITPTIQSNDSDRILRLFQGSRGNLMMEVGKSPPRGDRSSLAVKSLLSKEGDVRRASAAQKLRGSQRGSWLRRLSSPNCSDDEKDGSDGSGRSGRGRSANNNSGRRRTRKEKRDPNRFSLTQINKPQVSKSGIGVEKGDSNRFSFCQQKQSTADDMPVDLQVEMNRSKNWDSMDILRDAAAEASGVDPDAQVDALFGLVGGVEEQMIPPPHPPRKTSNGFRRRPSIEEEASEISASEGVGRKDHEEDKVSIMASTLSRGLSSAHDDAAMATAITERRKSVDGRDVQYGGSAIHQRGLSSVKDIPVIIQAVRSRPMDKKCTERAFQSLFLLATEPDPDGSLARKEILTNGGMETLVSAIWDHMQNSQVLLALFHALWAILVFNEEDEAFISEIPESGVLEGLVFAMQSHATESGIQDSGCDLITLLSGLLPADTPEFKSAVVLLCTTVKGIDVRDAKAYSSCLDALNSLCQLSDENKREFAKAGRDCHSAIIRGLTSGDHASLETQELACQLFWCVTSDRAAVAVLSSNSELLLLRKIIDALKSVPCAKSSVHFYSAACGTLANLALAPNNHSKMTDLGVVPILCEAIYIYHFSVDVTSAACTALANLSASRDIRKSIASQGGTPALFSAMKSNLVNVNVQSEAFRALHNLCESSSDGKQAIAADLEIIIRSFFRHEGVKYIQQITCSIFCRLSGDEICRKKMMRVPGTYDAMVKIMKSNPKKKLVQKAACSVLRNLSKEEEITPTLLSKGFDSLVIVAMDTYSDSEELQECACTFLMNIGSSSPEALVEICSGEGITCIIKSMQTIPTSASVQQASCGALYAITNVDAHKNIAISAGAVDAVIYLMLVHPNEIKVLENAVNVLVNLSSLRKCTRTIANAGGISTVTEIMRSNPTSTGLILGGSRFIQNMSLSRREYADEALGGITPILGCMDEHPDCSKLVEESCKALRCLVLKSETCRDRLITADGIAVIEKTMKENSGSQRWQTLLLDELYQ